MCTFWCNVFLIKTKIHGHMQECTTVLRRSVASNQRAKVKKDIQLKETYSLSQIPRGQAFGEMTVHENI